MLLFYPILIALASAQSIVPDPSQDSPDDYAPSTNLQCPSITTAPLLRQFSAQNQTLHPQESQYVDSRAQLSLPDAWNDWLGDGSDISYNVTAFAGHHAKIGIAIPGGGLRAALYAAGCLSGLDARNTSAKAAGTGGLLQVSSYITGLSGVCSSGQYMALQSLNSIEQAVRGSLGRCSSIIGPRRRTWCSAMGRIFRDGFLIFL